MNQSQRVRIPEQPGMVLTDAGLETTLIFREGLELPYFAAFDLLKNEPGRSALRKYFRTHAAIARRHDAGFVFESPTWRANPDWAERLGYTSATLAEANARAMVMLRELRGEMQNHRPMLVSGCVGPRGDGYKVEKAMSDAGAERYHAAQINTLSEAGAEMITAITMTYAEEAIGVVRAARTVGLPVVISFTVETDGRLPSGQKLKHAVEQVDQATGAAPAYYMINCAHPSHFDAVLETDVPWVRRIRGLRANASMRSHAELDEATELDIGNPAALGDAYRDLRERLPHLNVLGGCCGTDERHIAAIAEACADGMRV